MKFQTYPVASFAVEEESIFIWSSYGVHILHGAMRHDMRYDIICPLAIAHSPLAMSNCPWLRLARTITSLTNKRHWQFLYRISKNLSCNHDNLFLSINHTSDLNVESPINPRYGRRIHRRGTVYESPPSFRSNPINQSILS